MGMWMQHQEKMLDIAEQLLDEAKSAVIRRDGSEDRYLRGFDRVMSELHFWDENTYEVAYAEQIGGGE